MKRFIILDQIWLKLPIFPKRKLFGKHFTNNDRVIHEI